jgi:pimeloyl-ACP methyl ester carboxylesterase
MMAQWGNEGTLVLSVDDMDIEAVSRTDPGVPKSQRPPMRLIIAEAVALIGAPSALPLDPVPQTVRRGDGHAVLVLPALLGGDPYTTFVRQFLTSLGYSAHGWNLGLNIGPTKRLLDGASDRLVELSNLYGPLSVVGFSMGGLFARWLSLRMPDRIRQVITVCSPIHEPIRNFWLPLEPFLGLWPSNDILKVSQEIARPLPVPGTFLFSRDDGCVNYASCWDTNATADDHIEISGPHVLIARNPRVLDILAQRLARQVGV